jgi:hypothetical protein
MTSKHTPGPWEIDREVRTSINMGAKHIALVNFYNSPDAERNVSGEEHEANVRLIAAAPELLDALEMVLGKMPDWNQAGETVQQIKAALAKAGAA